MSLIDLDKVRWKEGFYDMHTGEQFAPMMFNTPEWLEWATANAKVKAIPKEWIRDYMLRLSDGSEAYECILVMLEDWEKENANK